MGSAGSEGDDVAAEGDLALQVLRPRRVGVDEPVIMFKTLRLLL